MEGEPAPGAAPVADCKTIGFEFVRQFYNTRHQNVEDLHRYYSIDESVLTLGLEDGETVTVHGQRNIHEKMVDRGVYKDIDRIKIDSIDCQTGPAGSILIQVVGLIVFKGFSDAAPKKFCQTFCLDKEQHGDQVSMFIRNDIFRFLQEPEAVVAEPEAPVEAPAAAQVEPEPVVVEAAKEEPAKEAAPAEPVAEPAAVVEEPAKVEPVPAPAAEAEAAETADAKAAPEEPAQPAPVEPKAEPPVETAAPAEPKPSAAPAVVVPGPPLNWAQRAAKPQAAPTVVTMPKPVPAPAPPVRVAAPVVKPTPAPPHQHHPTHTPRCPPPLGMGKSLYVKNVPTDCKIEDLVETFKPMGDVRVDSKFGPCINIQNMKQPPKDGRVSRYAFIEFATEEALRKTLAPENRKSFKIRNDSGTFNLLIEERKIPDKTRDGRGRGRGRGRGDGRGRGGRGEHRGRGRR